MNSITKQCAMPIVERLVVSMEVIEQYLLKITLKWQCAQVSYANDESCEAEMSSAGETEPKGHVAVLLRLPGQVRNAALFRNFIPIISREFGL